MDIYTYIYIYHNIEREGAKKRPNSSARNGSGGHWTWHMGGDQVIPRFPNLYKVHDGLW